MTSCLYCLRWLFPECVVARLGALSVSPGRKATFSVRHQVNHVLLLQTSVYSAQVRKGVVRAVSAHFWFGKFTGTGQAVRVKVELGLVGKCDGR